MKDLFKEELLKIQHEYLLLLRSIQRAIKLRKQIVVDEINLFWLQRKKAVTFALENYFCPYKTFVFTAASYVNYDENEHFPFALCDGVCLIDDAVSHFGSMYNMVSDNSVSAVVYEEISNAIYDNIKILENCSSRFYILPIRMFFQEESNVVHTGAEHAFLKLFNTPFKSMSDYIEHVVTVEDLKLNLSEMQAKQLLLGSSDNCNLSIEERIENYIQNDNSDIDLSNKSIGEIFMFAVYSNIAQAINVILFSTKYRCIPYLRYNVAFHYFTHLISNVGSNKEIKEIELKAYTCHLIYKVFDCSKVKNGDFDKFLLSIEDKNIFTSVYDKLYRNEEEIQQIAEFAHNEIEKIIEQL